MLSERGRYERLEREGDEIDATLINICGLLMDLNFSSDVLDYFFFFA